MLGFEFPVLEMEIDLSNNLIVLLGTRGSLTDPPHIDLHLRTLSDNTPHPSARNPILFSVSPTLAYHHLDALQVMGPFLGVVCFDVIRALEIWDWMNGQKMMRFEDSSFYSYKFLSATSFLISSRGSAEVYEIPVESPGTPPSTPHRSACQISDSTRSVIFGSTR
ncbi:hypothetical protein BS47DRAFT_88912 [Hydnum rufescens UP504]|uniref:Uncharacterized protein n=1 Tax=Hydnum rufescens UP504 TaxID=1448309 RepID=A0A9P6AQY5_9AGAM|nr:hypothetical protein BS47DRAFT_88912 [Hydnum rufescens UP504]